MWGGRCGAGGPPGNAGLGHDCDDLRSMWGIRTNHLRPLSDLRRFGHGRRRPFRQGGGTGGGDPRAPPQPHRAGGGGAGSARRPVRGHRRHARPPLYPRCIGPRLPNLGGDGGGCPWGRRRDPASRRGSGATRHSTRYATRLGRPAARPRCAAPRPPGPGRPDRSGHGEYSHPIERGTRGDPPQLCSRGRRATGGAGRQEEKTPALMGHVVHLYFPPPWTGKSITLDDRQRHHLEVLRHQEGDRVTYTDGEGTFGQGLRIGNSVERGTEEFRILDRAGLVLAVAPPPERERQRFLVEKLAELGVDRLMWLRCRYGEGRPATR